MCCPQNCCSSWGPEELDGLLAWHSTFILPALSFCISVRNSDALFLSSLLPYLFFSSLKQLCLLPQGQTKRFSIKMSMSLALNIWHQSISQDCIIYCCSVQWKGGCASVPTVWNFDQPSHLKTKFKELLVLRQEGKSWWAALNMRTHLSRKSLFLLPRFGPSRSFFPKNAISLPREEL